MIVERAREQLPFIGERDFVGTVRGAEHRDHHAADRDRNDDADRDHDAEAHVIPTQCLAFAGVFRRSLLASSFPNAPCLRCGK